MKLNELISVKKYKTKSIHDVTDDFEKNGGQLLGRGEKGTILWHPKWNYVFKTFVRDDPYLRFVRFIKKNPNKSFPNIIGGPWKIIPFYRRKLNEPYLYVVKLEKLEKISDPELANNIARYVNSGWHLIEEDKLKNADHNVELYIQVKNKLDQAKQSKDFQEIRSVRREYQDVQNWKFLYEMRLLWEKYPTLKELCEAFRLVMMNNIGVDDLHNGNFMQRADGTLVVIDPVWDGETFWQMYDRQMRNELFFGDEEEIEPDEYNSLMGGKIHPKKKPKSIRNSN